MRITLASGTEAELATSTDAFMGLVLLPDIMGLRPLLDEHCGRLARDNNWNVCSFELFAGATHLDRDERVVLHALREDLCKLRHLLLDGLLDLESIGARRLEHADAGGRLLVEREDLAVGLRAQFDPADVAHPRDVAAGA